MNEEPIPRKLEDKNDLQEEVKVENKEKKGKRICVIFFRVFFVLLFLVFVFETVIGVLNLQKIEDNKDPVWYLNIEEKQSNGKKETIYNLGLYVIVKSESGNEYKITLRPFFLK